MTVAWLPRRSFVVGQLVLFNANAAIRRTARIGFARTSVLDSSRSCWCAASVRLRSGLTRLLSRVGVARLVNEVVAPLNVAVGDTCIRGKL